MRKTLIAAAIIAAGVAGYYAINKTSSPASVNLSELEYVPADTALFSGQFTAIDLVSYLKSLGMSSEQLNNDEMQQAMAALSAESSPAVKFGVALFQDYMTILGAPDDFVKNTGIAAKTRSLTYLVGAAPVARFEVTDAAAFQAFFERAAAKSGVIYQTQQLAGHSYQVYSLSELLDGLELLVSVDRGWGTVALHSSKLPETHRAQALAQQKPTQNLGNNSKLADISKKYQLKQDGLGFFSTEQLGLAFTTTDGNQLAKDLQLTFTGGLPEPLHIWHTAECRADVAMLTKTWPGLVMDAEIKQQNASGMAMSSKMLFPTESKIALEGLQGLQGYIPSSLNGSLHSSMFYMALGTEISQLTPAISKIWAGMTDLSLKCEPLVAVQQQLKDQNPMMMLAMAGMAANGLQGVSVTINGFSMDMATGQPTSADALITLSADNPQALLANAKAMVPPLAGITLPADGEEISVAEIFPPIAMMGLDARLKASGNHLLLYVGDKAKAQADVIGKEKLRKNGLMSFGMDYKQFFTAMSDMITMSGQPMPPELESMMNTDMQLGLSFGIDQHGVVIATDMKLAE
ncbi:hypothetical protein GCM10010919_09540 [Alishewanella longhuensis]|uniref:DUF3352 domain-containing protein n=1 Tax=Alishewanella longhuensis TaxID=1091037 RepID=A0ABQ3KVN8_9ALTE|nr:hypothetical protein [Alishewanella longhuensis]GHG63642.1 hypothetical protein GCM10010919_09540 [Alishewanella longhuensis]